MCKCPDIVVLQRIIPQVALVIVDSVTFHFRQDFDDMAGRARVLAGLAQQAAELAEAHDVAVVYMNQVRVSTSTEQLILTPQTYLELPPHAAGVLKRPQTGLTLS